MKVRKLEGYSSYRALQAYHALLLGLKMLPAYRSDSYEDFYAKARQLSDEKKETLIREASLFVTLDRDEILALLQFVEDPNGVAFGAHNINSLTPDQFMEVIVSVCLEISKVKIDFVTESEKKN